MKLSLNDNYQIDASTLTFLDASIFEIISKDVISEYDLIKALQAEPYCLFSAKSLSKSLSLFHTHFFVFNSLFRLKQQGEESGEFSIHIETNAIKLYGQSIKINDPRHESLASYYLDWKNIDASETQIDQLLASFWQEFERYQNTITVGETKVGPKPSIK